MTSARNCSEDLIKPGVVVQIRSNDEAPCMVVNYIDNGIAHCVLYNETHMTFSNDEVHIGGLLLIDEEDEE